MTHTRKFILTSVVATLLIWTSYWVVCCLAIPDPAVRGQFGDTFGAINALFTSLTFAGLIYTTVLQREELALQRQELIETREELARSADAQAEGSRTLERQLQIILDSTLAHTVDALLRTRYEMARQMIDMQRSQPDSVKGIQPHWDVMLAAHAEKIGEHMKILEEIVARLRPSDS